MTTPAQTTGTPSQTGPHVLLTELPDPPQSPDMTTQLPDISRAHYTLEVHYMARGDVVVMGNGYLCQDASDVRRAPYPDLIVAFDMTIPPADVVASNGYTISEIGKPPDFVLEVASASTGRRDYTEKREIYAGYRVAEYWRFDRTGGQFHDAALAGDRLLSDGQYGPMPVNTMNNGVVRGYSPVLGLELRWVEGKLRFWDPATGEYLPDLTEAKAQTAAAIAQRDAAEERIRQLEAELSNYRSTN